jgi:hypothetical protein
MRNTLSLRLSLAAIGLFGALLATAQTARPAPPTRPVDGPGAPKFTVAGRNAPVDTEGDYVIGPAYFPAPELTVVEGVPQGTVRQFTMESKDSKIYPVATAREKFGTVDPNNPKTLIVETHEQPWSRAITVYVPAQYKRGQRAPFIVVHDGPKMGEPDKALPTILDNLIARKRVPAMIAVFIQNGGGDAQGHQRGLEYDTLSGRFAEFIQTEVLPAVEKNYGVKLTDNPDGRAAMGCSSGAAVDGLVSPGVVPPHRQLFGHVREPAVAVQCADTRRRVGVSQWFDRECRAEADPHLDARRRPRPLQSERDARRHARLGHG